MYWRGALCRRLPTEVAEEVTADAANTVNPLQAADILMCFDTFTIHRSTKSLEAQHRRLVMEIWQECAPGQLSSTSGTNSISERKSSDEFTFVTSLAFNIYYMEAFEMRTRDSASLKLKCGFRYVDDDRIYYLVQWKWHGIRISEQFKEISSLPWSWRNMVLLLNVFVSRTPDGTAVHRVYRKLTHNDSFLNFDCHCHHYLSSERLVLAIKSTRIHPAGI
ncbi:hypothetical protein NQ315_015543 [Exocentrus adspersus]|uniref:Uncharacterized protein n=1 Tax=Exocentrus adspersus TaxID=1586481 RepID=A0AAV8VA86_9CUCU|nr:hypothetical protein NQ315_015543 [Exocentrus adspersus]